MQEFFLNLRNLAQDLKIKNTNIMLVILKKKKMLLPLVHCHKDNLGKSETH